MSATRWSAPSCVVTALCCLVAARASSAEVPYPFEGTWVRPERACTATTLRERTYTAKDVLSPRGRCTIKRVATSGNSFELLEECRFNDRTTRVTETIRMTSPDSMALKRQLNRLKIPRQIRYIRCTVAAPVAPPPLAKPAKPVLPEPKPHQP